ncbi:MAG: CvpA family protein [Deltaproteobacteria bacterium]|jgi:membrane protein required for colicin V production|nr:CvpA family protein [Deltaproteobacteria bacterium]
MSALDIALTVILSYFFIRGVFRGLVKEVVGILGLFVAFWAASSYWQMGSEQLTPITDNPTYRGVLSFMAIYVVIYFLIGLISLFVDKIVKMTITPFVSGLVGAFLGLLKGLVLCSIILTATTAFVRPDQSFYQESAAWPKLEPLCDQVKAWVPAGLKQLMNPQTAFRAVPSDQTPARGQALVPPGDFQSLKKILTDHSELISAPWQEKIRNLTGPENLDPEDLKRFIRDHPNLFAVTPSLSPPAGARPLTAPPQAAQPAQPSPSWPSPAVE